MSPPTTSLLVCNLTKSCFAALPAPSNVHPIPSSSYFPPSLLLHLHLIAAVFHCSAPAGSRRHSANFTCRICVLNASNQRVDFLRCTFGRFLVSLSSTLPVFERRRGRGMHERDTDNVFQLKQTYRADHFLVEIVHWECRRMTTVFFRGIIDTQILRVI